MTKPCFYVGHIDALKSWCACYASVRYIVPIQWPIYAQQCRTIRYELQKCAVVIHLKLAVASQRFCNRILFWFFRKKARTMFVYVWWMLRLIVHRLECSFFTNPISKFEWLFFALTFVHIWHFNNSFSVILRSVFVLGIFFMSFFNISKYLQIYHETGWLK